MVLGLVAADGRREPRRRLGQEEQRAHRDEEPGLAAARSAHARRAASSSSAHPATSATAPATINGQRMERARGGERQRQDARDAETGRDAGEQVLVARIGQGSCDTEQQQAAGRAGGQDRRQHQQVDHSAPRR